MQLMQQIPKAGCVFAGQKLPAHPQKRDGNEKTRDSFFEEQQPGKTAA